MQKLVLLFFSVCGPSVGSIELLRSSLQSFSLSGVLVNCQ